jgi:hypothetical protein
MVIITPENAIAELTRRGHLGVPKNLGNEKLRKAAGLATALTGAQLWEVAGMSKPTKTAKRKPVKGKSKAKPSTSKSTQSRSTLGLTKDQLTVRAAIIDRLGGGPGNDGWNPEEYRRQMDLAGIPRKVRGKDNKGKVTNSDTAATDRYAKKNNIALA